MIKSTPVTQSSLLKNLLTNRFPDIEFRYRRFRKSEIEKQRKDIKDQKIYGVIAELKSLTANRLSLFDTLCKQYTNVPIVFILSPEAYQTLNKKRPKTLHQHMVAISEAKSLDYMFQLPRLVEEIHLKDRLRTQNKRLKRLVEEHRPQWHQLEQEHSPQKELIISDILNTSERSNPKGLKIKLQRWHTVKKSLGMPGKDEISKMLSRMISNAVRSSDRVLQYQDDEFLIFLSNVETTQLKKCRERIESTLNGLEITVNDQSFSLPFEIQALHSN